MCRLTRVERGQETEGEGTRTRTRRRAPNGVASVKKTMAARGTKEEVHLSPLLSEMLSFFRGRQQARSTRGSKRTAPRPSPSHFQSPYLAKLAALAQVAGSTRPNVASLPLFVLFGTLLLTNRWQHNAQREVTSSRRSLRAAWPQLQKRHSPTKHATHMREKKTKTGKTGITGSSPFSYKAYALITKTN